MGLVSTLWLFLLLFIIQSAQSAEFEYISPKDAGLDREVPWHPPYATRLPTNAPQRPFPSATADAFSFLAASRPRWWHSSGTLVRRSCRRCTCPWWNVISTARCPLPRRPGRSIGSHGAARFRFQPGLRSDQLVRRGVVRVGPAATSAESDGRGSAVLAAGRRTVSKHAADR